MHVLKKKPDVQCHAVPGLQTNLGTIMHIRNKILTKKSEARQGPLQILNSLTNYQTLYLTTLLATNFRIPSFANQSYLNPKQDKSTVYTLYLGLGLSDQLKL